MRRRLSLEFPIDMYEDLREEALKHKTSIADVVRQKILKSNDSIPKKPEEPTLSGKDQKQEDEVLSMILEILLLLREFLFERNGQILKKVDEKMEKRFGKERRKIV
jgi:hypothetical protein